MACLEKKVHGSCKSKLLQRIERGKWNSSQYRQESSKKLPCSNHQREKTNLRMGKATIIFYNRNTHQRLTPSTGNPRSNYEF